MNCSSSTSTHPRTRLSQSNIAGLSKCGRSTTKLHVQICKLIEICPYRQIRKIGVIYFSVREIFSRASHRTRCNNLVTRVQHTRHQTRELPLPHRSNNCITRSFMSMIMIKSVAPGLTWLWLTRA